MKRDSLNYFLCPQCQNNLYIDEQQFQSQFCNANEDLLQGVLACACCNAQYPVIGGIPVLIREIEDWLRKNHASILRGTHECFEFSKEMLTWLNAREWSLGNQSQDNYYENPRWIEIFVRTHFDQVRPGTGDPSAVGLALVEQKQVFEVCQEMLSSVIEEPVQLALDVGCNVGGMSYRLKTFASQVLAIDTAFTSLLTAKRILNQLPTALRKGVRRIDGNIRESFDIDANNKDCDFLLGPVEEIHFNKEFDLITSLNVIDCVPSPEIFVDKLVKLLKPKGLLLITSPYSWASDDVPRDNWLTQSGFQSDQALQMLLESKGMQVLDSRDHVPWVLTEHVRWYRVFSNHCILAQKK